ncbi:chemotaxis protein MotB [Loktanella fryxellensis]|uniref:Chemotaxis protein MotB n=1 Tax=Loktanella fryxellensis TaxID=245187 RepID=A0A1H7ZNB4_9RHOB|nr:flagellar motor protein MotB [Loktanella fryxellensis]SEM59825.1 chemotaxis protein MotB [Loktanella fryxellensis]
MSAPPNRPIIIKRKKVVAGGGHHGGAWKVAYADFVTAMMAFFLLMWLLSSASEEQKLGIADYFAPTIPFVDATSGGDGALHGDSLHTKDTNAQNGTGGIAEMDGGVSAGAAEVQALRDLETALLGVGGESFLTENAMRHVITRLTDEGLVIEIFDLPGAPLFTAGTADPLPVTVQIADMLANILRIVANPVAVTSHVAGGVPESRVWSLSSDRAARMQMLLHAGDLDPLRMVRVTAKADRDPVTDDVTAVRNNRIEIIVVRSDL